MPEKELKINFDDLPEPIKEAIDLETGKIRDFISEEWVDATSEEIEAVQIFARRLVEDYGYSKEQVQTHPQFKVRKRPSDERREYPVDIAVFRSKRKIESELFLIVECKQPNKRQGIRQLKIYMDLSPAIVGVWFNGKEHAYIRKVQKIDGTIDYVEIPNIPRKGQRIEDIGLFKREDLRPTRNLKAVFKDIRNHLSQQAVGITRDEILAQEVMNLLFCKIYDEKNTAPEEIVTFRSGVNEDPHDVAKRIKDLFKKVKDEYSDIFDKSDSINLDDNSVNYVVGELQNYCITEADRDVLGDAFEVFIGPALKGAQGQFFTPRNVVKLAVEILNPNPGDIIIDPACGSGGFLIVALEQVWSKIKTEAEKRGFSEEWIKSKQREIANKCIRGIDKDGFLAKVTKAYMAIVGDGRGGIFCENSLEPLGRWHNKTREKISFNSFDILLTNPPFGSKIPVGEREILEIFDLGYKWQKKKKGELWEKTSRLQEKQPPQILFIERCLEFLRPGGKMAIVLPDGVLGGSRVGYIAHFIRKNAKVLALIDCPKETFQPFVSTKTHLVFLQKKTEEEKKQDDEYQVFMGIADHVGHDSKGKPLFKEEKGNRVINDDFPKIVLKYKEFKKGDLTKDKFDRYGYIVSSKWLENYLVARRYLPKYIEALEELESLKKDGKVELKL
jgi:type I restriction enzyme M protein